MEGGGHKRSVADTITSDSIFRFSRKLWPLLPYLAAEFANIWAIGRGGVTHITPINHIPTSFFKNFFQPAEKIIYVSFFIKKTT